MGDPYLGEIRMFAGNYAPVNWELCAGQSLAIADYYELYTLLGTTYGGDGVISFALPDLRSRVPIHRGQGLGLSNRMIGQMGGEEQVTLISSQLPLHTHPVNANAGLGTQASPAGGVWAEPVTGAKLYASGSANQILNGGMVLPAGGSQPHDNLPPFLTINFIIAVAGTYPPQNRASDGTGR